MKPLSRRPAQAPQWKSLKFDLWIGNLLRVGVVSSVFLIALGTVWHLINTDSLQLDYDFHRTNLFQFLAHEAHRWVDGPWRPRMLVNTGIALLMMTPYLRVLSCVVYFTAVEKNAKYALFTAFVLSCLTYSLFLS